MTIRWLDHTADLAVEVEGPTEAECLAELVRATTQAIAGESPIDALERTEVDVEGADSAERAVALANEIIFLWDARRWLAARVEALRTDGGRLTGVLVGEPYDPDRHEIEREVKAATHHQASSAPVGGAWRARIVYDL